MATALEERLGQQLSARVIDLRDGARGLVTDRMQVIDALLDLRNLAEGRELGLELTVDELLRVVPTNAPVVSTEWWQSALAELEEYATYLGS